MTFQDLDLIEPIQRAIQTEGYTIPTPIQQQAIPLLLQRKDLLGCAQTGTGKTAAFAIPILQLLYEEQLGQRRPNTISALILTPTRELAIQIDESFRAYGRHTGLRTTVIFGGVGQKPQTDALHRGIDILVATPGRLLDLMNQGFVNLGSIKFFVLDEADRMLDMGFVHDVKKVIAKLPARRQSLFFSATMPPEIQKLADTILTEPEKVEVTPVSSTADTVTQHIFFVEKGDKRFLLQHLLLDKKIKTALVFTRTKHGADRVAKDLIKSGIRAAAIHGNKSQSARQNALADFKEQKIRCLIATDIAARGIDIDDLSTVVNFELPNIPESYVHRIGRTGRAGASGVAYSFCEEEERAYLKDIQKLIGRVLPVISDHPFPSDNKAPVLLEAPRPQRSQPQKGLPVPPKMQLPPTGRPANCPGRHGQTNERRPGGPISHGPTNSKPARTFQSQPIEKRANGPVSQNPSEGKLTGGQAQQRPQNDPAKPKNRGWDGGNGGSMKRPF